MSLKYEEISALPSIKRGHDTMIQPWIPRRGRLAWEGARDLRRRDSQAAIYSGLHEVDLAIEASRWILNLGDDFFEDPESPRYSVDTWKRATEFLRAHIHWAREEKGIDIEVPMILPGPSGNIDLHWKTSAYELLLSIPADSATQATFYGDDYASGVVKLRLDQSNYRFEPLVFLAKK